MSFPEFPFYKPSNLGWLGAIPSHWEMTRIKRSIPFTVGWTPPTGKDEFYEGTASWANIGDMQSRIISETQKSISDEAIRVANISLSPKGSLLFSFKLSIGRVAFAGVDIYTNEAISTFYDGFGFDLRFAYYSFPIFIVMNASENIYGAKMLNQDLIKNAILPMPPLPEQVAIAAFLDRETAKIDALVEEQRRLIALLAEKRQAVISHAVTKGLDPTVPMKDSGVEGLGEVPAHWEVKRLKHLGCFSAGAGFPDREQGLEGEALSFHKVNALGKAGPDGYLLPSENTISIETALRLRAFVFPPDAIVFAKIGAALLLGRLRMLRVPACLDNNMMGFVVQSPNKFRYIRYLMSQIRFDLIANPGAVPSLNESQIANLAFAIPCSVEQEKITIYLDNEIFRSDALTAEAQAAITLLQERRAALISAAVTGKIDVRGLGPAVEEAA